MKKKTLPSIRISEETYSNIESAIRKYNENSLLELSIQEFRRLSYELLSQMILQDKELPVKLSRL